MYLEDRSPVPINVNPFFVFSDVALPEGNPQVCLLLSSCLVDYYHHRHHFVTTTTISSSPMIVISTISFTLTLTLCATCLAQTRH
jgi:hypothetical protein